MKVIGVAGFARCGKDTFVKIAMDILKKNSYTPMRLAFADMLKEEVEAMLKQNKFQATVKTEDSASKTLIRPLLVWWGCQRRYETDGGLYWVNEVDNQIQDIINDAQSGGMTTERMVAFVSDVRFPNEAKWVHEKWGGSVIHLKKWQWKEVRDGCGGEETVKVYDSAPNEEEAKQDPLVEAMADVKTEWEGKGHKSAASASAEKDLQKVVFDALNQTKFFKHPEPIIGTLTL
jgi:hypothetical protein